MMKTHPEWTQLVRLVKTKGVEVDFRLQDVLRKYPFRISAHIEKEILEAPDSLWRQMIPTVEELLETELTPDPLSEGAQSPVLHLVHRYPDRVLLLTTDECAIYCRFCLRKRRVGTNGPICDADFENVLTYIKTHETIREVIFSGGDPLTIPDERLKIMFQAVKEIPHVNVIRIHTRMLTANPTRITASFIQLLQMYAPVYLMTHFNTVDEISQESQNAIEQLVNAGVVLGNQSVLLKGINDSTEALSRLWQKLVDLRVRPYYLHHPDPIAGTGHFRIGLRKGLQLYRELAEISGLCLPRYVVDLPGGKGKISVEEGAIAGEKPGKILLRIPTGEIVPYPDCMEEDFYA